MFFSVLFPDKEQRDKLAQKEQKEAPAFFKDLNLDQIFKAVLESKEEFDLERFFRSPQYDPQIILYRQGIMRDLENKDLRKLLDDFSHTVYEICREAADIRKWLSSYDSYYNNYLTRGKLIDCTERYCKQIAGISKALSPLTKLSEGLRSFFGYIEEYCASQEFTGLCDDIKRLRDEFSEIQYCMLIKHGKIKIRKYEGQANHTEQILACFEKFRQGDVKDYRHEVSEEPGSVHVEASVLKLLARQYKSAFNGLGSFCAKYFRFEDAAVAAFSREIQFYLSWLDYIEPIEDDGLPFCYPLMSESIDGLYSADGFDLALAHIIRGETVVNSFALNSPERVIVVTGPNQGGKSTFARAFGQMHYLASLGLRVPGREAALFLFDGIYTHFGREEYLSAQNGKLQDDLVRLRCLLDSATSRSIVIINEIFTATSLSNAIMLGKHMMDAIAALRAPAVVVTFLDELAAHGAETVSMMSTVDEKDPIRRTFRIIRKPPTGLAYAMHIAGKYGLTYEQLRRRLIK